MMLEKNPLITQTNPKSPISEAYRVLRTNLQFSSVDKPLKNIVITSAVPEEGKTTTIVNLAMVFAQSGSKTLLIDADLRRPNIHKVFDLFNHIGVTNILAKHDDYKQYLRKVNVENLHVLTSGPIPPNPSELLASQSMQQFIEKINQDYDIVLMDAPPVGIVTDAAILSTIVDGTILVANSGVIEIDAIQRAKESLDKVNANIVGVVLNRLTKDIRGGYYCYDFYYDNGDDTTLQEITVRKKSKRYWSVNKAR